jgi:hypothetical protein
MVSTQGKTEYEVDEICHGQAHDQLRKKKCMGKKLEKAEMKETRSVSRTVESIDEEVSSTREKNDRNKRALLNQRPLP